MNPKKGANLMTDTLKFYLASWAAMSGVEPLQAPRPGDAGYDIRAAEAWLILPGETRPVRTGLRIELPPGFVGLIKGRSSIATAGLIVVGGVIDSAFRGEVVVLLHNVAEHVQTVDLNDCIAQMVIMPYLTLPVERVPDASYLSETERGEGGFGSTNYAETCIVCLEPIAPGTPECHAPGGVTIPMCAECQGRE